MLPRVAPHRRHLVVDERRVVEHDVLRPADAARELSLDGHRVVEVVSHPAAGGVDIEVHFLVVVAADEERAAAGKAANLDLPCTDRCILGRRGRASCEQDQARQGKL